MVSRSEAADRCRAIRSAKTKSATKMRILDMINRRTGGEGLRDYRAEFKGEGNRVARHDVHRLRARVSVETAAEEKRAVQPKINRVFNSIDGTLLRSLYGQSRQKLPVE